MKEVVSKEEAVKEEEAGSKEGVEEEVGDFPFQEMFHINNETEIMRAKEGAALALALAKEGKGANGEAKDEEAIMTAIKNAIGARYEEARLLPYTYPCWSSTLGAEWEMYPIERGEQEDLIAKIKETRELYLQDEAGFYDLYGDGGVNLYYYTDENCRFCCDVHHVCEIVAAKEEEAGVGDARDLLARYGQLDHKLVEDAVKTMWRKGPHFVKEAGAGGE